MTLGRHSDPSEEEISAAEQALRSQNLSGWLAIMEAVIGALRRAAAALDAGSQVRAEAALAAPAVFTLGPRATLARLAALPPLPRTGEAAGAAAAELDRLDRRR